ncbi:excalibur calcium-binding domain-containing protein [Streptococcus minor]|uniref:excalibur calcium-binding domain-containing protein n=1 Tax=Streptococcus minor TaxID=229549 RepID=UPI001C89ED08
MNVREAEQQQPQQFAQVPEQSAYYPNCSAVRAAGAAPLYVGQPGYSRKLDRDGDGVACE